MFFIKYFVLLIFLQREPKIILAFFIFKYVFCFFAQYEFFDKRNELFDERNRTISKLLTEQKLKQAFTILRNSISLLI